MLNEGGVKQEPCHYHSHKCLFVYKSVCVCVCVLEVGGRLIVVSVAAACTLVCGA